MHLEEGQKNGQNGILRIPENLPPKTQALIARIYAERQKRQAMGGEAMGGEVSTASESPAEAPGPEAQAFTTTPPAPRPSEAPREPRRAMVPRPVGEMVASILPRPLKGEELPPVDWAPSLLSKVEEALGRSERVAGLTPRARRLYTYLLAAGLARLRRMGRPITRALTQVILFVPVEALAVALDIPVRSLYRALTELKGVGLVASRAWYTPATVHGRPGIYRAGVVFAVRLPHRDGRAKLYPEDLQHKWRDLDGDIAAGRTAWAHLTEWQEARWAKKGSRRAKGASPGVSPPELAESKSSPLRGESEVLEFILGWGSLSPERSETPLEIDSANGSPSDLLARLAREKPGSRRRLVEEIALGLARGFRDPGSTRFYAWVIWHAFRAHIYGYRPDAMDIVLWAIRRVSEGLATGSVRRPGALLVRLLKEQGLMDLFRQAPSWRVA